MELLKQPLGQPLSMPEQVVLLLAAGEQTFSGFAPKEIPKRKNEFLQFMKVNYASLYDAIEEEPRMRPGILNKVREASNKWLEQLL